MHTHTFTCRFMQSCSQLEAGAMAEESCQGAGTASRAGDAHSTAPAHCNPPRDLHEAKCWALPHPLCLCCACFRHYVEFRERMLCFFKAQGVSSLWRPSHRLSVVCNPQWTFVGSQCCPNTGTHLSWPQQCGASVISVEVQRGGIWWHFLSTAGGTDCSTQTRYKNLPSLASASPCLILPRFLEETSQAAPGNGDGREECPRALVSPGVYWDPGPHWQLTAAASAWEPMESCSPSLS